MRLGRRNMMIAILRESLLSLTRLVPFVRAGAEAWFSPETPGRLKQLERDLRSLSAYEGQLTAEIVYLQEATLGLINLAQNRVIKVLSVAAVIFLPPTLVGTIYGMNFAHMPELDQPWAYPLTLAVMAASRSGRTGGSRARAGSRRRREKAPGRGAARGSVRLDEAASDQPTISLPAKNCAISTAAVSGASEPWTVFSPTDWANFWRMVPSRRWPGSSRP